MMDLIYPYLKARLNKLFMWAICALEAARSLIELTTTSLLL